MALLPEGQTQEKHPFYKVCDTTKSTFMCRGNDKVSVPTFWLRVGSHYMIEGPKNYTGTVAMYLRRVRQHAPSLCMNGTLLFGLHDR